MLLFLFQNIFFLKFGISKGLSGESIFISLILIFVSDSASVHYTRGPVPGRATAGQSPDD